MATSLIRLCFKKRLLNEVTITWQKCGQLMNQQKLWPCLLFDASTFPTCTRCHLLHTSSINHKRRKTAEERKAPKLIEYSPKSKTVAVDVWKNMTVEDVAKTLNKDLDHVFEAMMYVDNSIDYSKPESVIDNLQVIKDIVKKSGMKPRVVAPPDLREADKLKDRDAVRQPPPDPSVLVKRSPVVTVMGHVDHGKTTLLDSLRNTAVVASEFGGITQHIGAFSVKLNSGDTMTFLDTPGHAAFTTMRARGADVTDIVVLVVAADDGVMEQTIESIRMAREANVPIIVAINKIDKPEADIERTKRMLVQNGIQVEDVGGDVQVVPISALKGINLDLLTEAIVLQAELMELKGDPRGLVEGVVIESRTDPHRGKLSTVIIKRGTLRRGTVLVAGEAWAKVRSMFDEQGHNIQEAPPSTPVEVIGWRDLPSAGDELLEVESERRAHEVMRWRGTQKLAKKQIADQEVVEKKVQEHYEVYKAQLEKKRRLGRFKMRPTGPREKEIKDDDTGPKISVIVKAIIYTFNVKIPDKLEALAKSKRVVIKQHNIIYRLVDDLKTEINSRLPLKPVEEILGEANVLQEFKVTEGKKKVSVAGCRCVKGQLKKSAQYRLLHGQEIVHEGGLESMRHLKNEVDTIKKDVECGLRLNDDSVSFQPGDILQCYEIKHVKQETQWDPGF
uniref:Tr-type G domain-containing protein n=3 Tax=Timema TaxID=61471 RepID=A0A7R9IE81_9NEOP|nr:unnamed protein product [Timema tahoe]